MGLIWKAISDYWPRGLEHLVVEASFQNTTTKQHYKSQVAGATDVEYSQDEEGKKAGNTV
jgi:hypothetical protein